MRGDVVVAGLKRINAIRLDADRWPIPHIITLKGIETMIVKWCDCDCIPRFTPEERQGIHLIQISTNPGTWPDSTGFASVHRMYFIDLTLVDYRSALDRFKDDPKRLQEIRHRYTSLFDDKQAQQVWRYVFGLPEDAVLYVQCEAGISRSAGMAAAIAFVTGNDPREMHNRAMPNMYVMGKMLENYPRKRPMKRYQGIEVISNEPMEHHDKPSPD